jgi:primosomal protein N' (replication factor Y)
VVVQAWNPRHVSITTGVAQDYEAFARSELPQRLEAGYPPYTRLVRVITHAPDESAALKRIEAVAARLAEPALPGVVVLGPAPAPIPRINRQHRYHLVAKCDDDGAVSALLGRLVGHTGPVRKARVLVDVDPVSML